jgi:hypothetical protein
VLVRAAVEVAPRAPGPQPWGLLEADAPAVENSTVVQLDAFRACPGSPCIFQNRDCALEPRAPIEHRHLVCSIGET